MSFAAQTKKELTSLEVQECCMRSELSALIRMNGILTYRDRKFVLDVTTENAAIARVIYSYVKSLYQVPSELLVRKKMRLKKNNIYVVRVTMKVREILESLNIVTPNFEMKRDISSAMIRKSCCKRSYLRGAFLAGGSVNHPESSSYHLEIFSSYEEHAKALVKLMNRFHLNAKYIERKKGYVVYIKESEKITEFLSIIGAHQALFQFEDVRIVKDMRNSVNRLVNCETANLNKTVSAAMKQLETIQLIEDKLGLEQLPDKLREIAEVRKQHPDVTLKELGDMIPSGKVSKSGINHRLRKLNEIADKLR
ncbi:DNA-binding protein WhiA [Caldalkalibacillus salinus]|uniref:DNA-binding protein WhiA n=1 Tax=Caldalkalibacillus salinus TaxID=2803787 RepID=UPI001921323F|nr:DNA-binding protein WhiA [Caldalkalibacillus salinus]